MTVEAYEPLLDAIYAAGEDTRQWETVLAALTSHLSGCGGGLHAMTMDGTGFAFGATYRVDPEALAAYAAYYYSINPLNSALSRVQVGSAVPDHQLVLPRDMERTEFQNDYARRFDGSSRLAHLRKLFLPRSFEPQSRQGERGADRSHCRDRNRRAPCS